MSLQLRPTLALNPQFVLPEVTATDESTQGQVWQRRTFRIGRFDLVLKVEPVLELLRDPAIYPLPFAPAACAGLINRRGSLIPVFDWQGDFGVAEDERNHSNVLVLGRGTEAVAIAISEVLEQISIRGEPDFSAGTAQDLPASLTAAIDGIIQYQGKLYFQLDHESILSQISSN